MIKQPLVSIILLSYKNYHYIYEALNSILSQDYTNIEIIVSNDGSDDFDKKAVEDFLNKNKKSNIKNIIVNNNLNNLGTVRNINKAIKLSKGDYIIIFAADDVIYSPNVVSKFIDCFKKLPKNELIVTSQLGMYDINLNNLIQPFVSKKNERLIKNLKPEKLFTEMATKCMLPSASNCFKRELFNKFGLFDEKYKLIEDYASALKFSRLGVKYNYFNFTSFKHRDGGISHGNVNGAETTKKQYDLDILNILTHEVLPYTKLMTKEQKKKFLQHYHDFKFRFKFKYKYKNGTKYERRLFVKKFWKSMLSSFLKEVYREIIAQLQGKKFKLFLIGILFCISSKILHISLIGLVLNFIGIILISTSIFLTIINFAKKYLFRIINLIKSIL